MAFVIYNLCKAGILRLPSKDRQTSGLYLSFQPLLMETLVCWSQTLICTTSSCPRPGFVSWHGMLWTADRHSLSSWRPIHRDTNSQCPVPTPGLDELQPPRWTVMFDTCSACFQQASLVRKHTCSHRKATCPRPGSAFACERKELSGVRQHQALQGTGQRSTQPVLSWLQVSYAACDKLLRDQVTANLQTRPQTYPSRCTSGTSNKHHWQQPQDTRISFHFLSYSFTPRSPITRLRTFASLLRSHTRQTLSAAWPKTHLETTCPPPTYQASRVQC